MRKLLPFIFILALLTGCARAPSFNSDADERLYRSIEGSGNLDEVQRSIEDGASIDEMKRGRLVSENMVEFAVYCGRPEIAAWLINNGADISYKTSIMGETLLMYTAAAAERDLCALLIEKGADASEADRLGDTALEYAFKAPPGVPERVIGGIVTLLLENGAELRRETLSAALSGHSGGGDGDCRYGLVRRIAEALRKAGVELRLRPALEAAILGSGDLSAALRSAGEADKLLALFFTAAFGTEDALRSIADTGISLKTTDSGGNTALIIAARYGNEDTARYLIGQKPDFAAKGDCGLDAADEAREAGLSELAELIESSAGVAAAAFSAGGCCECCQRG